MPVTARMQQEMMPDPENFDLRGRVVNVEQKFSEIASRVTAMEQRRMQDDIASARKDEQWNNLVEKFVGLNSKIDAVDTSLNKKMDDLNGVLKWLVKLIIGAIIAGFIAFMIRGGFNIQ